MLVTKCIALARLMVGWLYSTIFSRIYPAGHTFFVCPKRPWRPYMGVG